MKKRICIYDELVRQNDVLSTTIYSYILNNAEDAQRYADMIINSWIKEDGSHMIESIEDPLNDDIKLLVDDETYYRISIEKLQDNDSEDNDKVIFEPNVNGNSLSFTDPLKRRCIKVLENKGTESNIIVECYFNDTTSADDYMEEIISGWKSSSDNHDVYSEDHFMGLTINKEDKLGEYLLYNTEELFDFDKEYNKYVDNVKIVNHKIFNSGPFNLKEMAVKEGIDPKFDVRIVMDSNYVKIATYKDDIEIAKIPMINSSTYLKETDLVKTKGYSTLKVLFKLLSFSTK